MTLSWMMPSLWCHYCGIQTAGVPAEEGGGHPAVAPSEQLQILRHPLETFASTELICHHSCWWESNRLSRYTNTQLRRVSVGFVHSFIRSFLRRLWKRVAFITHFSAWPRDCMLSVRLWFCCFCFLELTQLMECKWFLNLPFRPFIPSPSSALSFSLTFHSLLLIWSPGFLLFLHVFRMCKWKTVRLI